MRRRPATTTLLAILGTLMLVSAVGCGPKVPPVEDVTAGSGETPAAPVGKPSEDGVVPMGSAGSAGDWTITVKTAERADSAGGAKAAEGKELLVISYELKNGSPADQAAAPVDYSLVDAAGGAYSAVPTSDPEFIFNIPQPIKAGETRSIRIAYEVPAGAGPFVWTFAPFGAATSAMMTVK